MISFNKESVCVCVCGGGGGGGGDGGFRPRVVMSML